MDRYRNELKRATYTWMEVKACSQVFAPLRSKDRVDGRAAKRRARQEDRAETARRAAGVADLDRHDRGY